MNTERVTARDAAMGVYRVGQMMGRALYLETRSADYPYRYAIGEIVWVPREQTLATTYADGSGTGHYHRAPRDVLASLMIDVTDAVPVWAEPITYGDLSQVDHHLARVGRDAMATVGESR